MQKSIIKLKSSNSLFLFRSHFLVLFFGLFLSASGCIAEQQTSENQNARNATAQKNSADSEKNNKEKKVVKLKLETNRGLIILELEPSKAPQTVANFVQYVNDGQYNGTVFHRTISGFMIQGGGYNEKLVKLPTRPPIKNEAATALSKGLGNDRGTIAMARTAAPDSATAQFFINVVDNDNLNAKGRQAGYAAFGRVISGMEVVDAIAEAPTKRTGQFADLPTETVVIQKAVVVEQ